MFRDGEGLQHGPDLDVFPPSQDKRLKQTTLLPYLIDTLKGTQSTPSPQEFARLTQDLS